MICIQLFGGLGNQMFQYACARNLAHINNTNIVLDTTKLSEEATTSYTKRSYELNIFNIDCKIAGKQDLIRCKPLKLRLLNYFSIKVLSRGIKLSNYYIEGSLKFDSSIFNVKRNSFVSGYWQSERYFLPIEKSIRDDFTFKNFDDEKNLNILEHIRRSNSISLHIRLGDYQKSSHKIHGTQPIDYYYRAIKYLSGKVKTPFFFIFSDDIEWVKKNLNIDVRHKFIDWNQREKSYLDMQLMSECKHNIISNSTFSWWGAWLNKHREKIVISPKAWFNDIPKNNEASDLVPENWIRK